MSCSYMDAQDAYPLLSRSNILNATEKLDSGMLSSVTKNMYLLPQNYVQNNYAKSTNFKQIKMKNIKMKNNLFKFCNHGKKLTREKI